jgi:hypothetical protein
MSYRAKSTTVAAVVVVLIAGLSSPALAADPTDEQITRAVRLKLIDGRIVAGTVNERTSESELWLHFHHPNLQMSAAFRWDQVESAMYFGRTLTPEELYRLAHQLKTAAPPPPPFHPLHGAELGPLYDFRSLHGPRSPHGVLPRSFRGIRDNLDHDYHGPRAGQTGRVVSLQAIARLAQWDSDAEIDGVELRVQPITSDGRLIPVNGNISASMHAATRPRYESERPTEELERWNESIRAEDFGPDGAIVRLPFRRRWPDRDLNTSNNGRVQVRLGVPGHGTFDATIPLNIRSIDPYRDHQQLYRR